MNTPDKDPAQQLLGQMEYLLNDQFLRFAYMGGMLLSAPSNALADLAIKQAQAPSEDFHWPSADEQICHEALCALIRDGLTLHQAVATARRSPAARTAFERLQARAMADLEARGSSFGEQV